MVHHDDGVVHDQAQGDGQPGKGIEVQVDFQEIKQDGRDAYIDDYAQEQHAEIPGIPVDQKDKSNKDQDGEPGTFVDFVQLFFQEFGVIVFQPYLKSGGEGAFGLFYRLLDFFRQQYLIGAFPGRDRQGDRVVAVDAVVPFRFGLFQRKRGQVAEIDLFAPLDSDQQVLQLRGVFQGAVDLDIEGLPDGIDGGSGIAAPKGGRQGGLQAATGEDIGLHLLDIVGDIKLQGGGAPDLDFPDVGKAVEDGLQHILRDFPDFKGGKGPVDAVGQYRHLLVERVPCGLQDQRITDLGIQVGVDLADERSRLELLEFHIGVFVKTQGDRPVVVVGYRFDLLEFRELGKYPFERGGGELFHQFGRGAVHAEGHPQHGFLFPGIEVHGELWHQGEADDGQDNESNDGSEGGQGCLVIG